MGSAGNCQGKLTKLKRLWPGRTTLGYIGVLAGCFVVAMIVGYLGTQIDNDAYDLLFRLNPPAPVKTQAVVVGIDDATFSAMGGTRRMRPILTQALLRIAEGQPKVVAIDILLHDQGRDPSSIAEDDALAAAIRKNRNVIMPTNLDNDQWEDPAPIFVPSGAVLGHIKADIGSRDGVMREISLSRAPGRGWRSKPSGSRVGPATLSNRRLISKSAIGESPPVTIRSDRIGRFASGIRVIPSHAFRSSIWSAIPSLRRA